MEVRSRLSARLDAWSLEGVGGARAVAGLLNPGAGAWAGGWAEVRWAEEVLVVVMAVVAAVVVPSGGASEVCRVSVAGWACPLRAGWRWDVALVALPQPRRMNLSLRMAAMTRRSFRCCLRM